MAGNGDGERNDAHELLTIIAENRCFPLPRLAMTDTIEIDKINGCIGLVDVSLHSSQALS